MLSDMHASSGLLKPICPTLRRQTDGIWQVNLSQTISVSQYTGADPAILKGRKFYCNRFTLETSQLGTPTTPSPLPNPRLAMEIFPLEKFYSSFTIRCVLQACRLYMANLVKYCLLKYIFTISLFLFVGSRYRIS